MARRLVQARHIGVVCHARSTSNDVIAFTINTPDKSRRKKGKETAEVRRAQLGKTEKLREDRRGLSETVCPVLVSREIIDARPTP